MFSVRSGHHLCAHITRTFWPDLNAEKYFSYQHKLRQSSVKQKVLVFCWKFFEPLKLKKQEESTLRNLQKVISCLVETLPSPTLILFRFQQTAELVLEHEQLLLDEYLLTALGQHLLGGRMQVQLTALVLLL